MIVVRKVAVVIVVLMSCLPFCMQAMTPHGESQVQPVEANESPEPPFDLSDEARITKGKTRFGSSCAAYCHGNEGSGGKTPAFKGRNDLQPDEIFHVITNGRKGADVMPAFRGFSAEKRWELVAYIVWLGQQDPD